MERQSYPNGPGVDSIVEEDYKGARPVVANGKRMAPASGTTHLMGREVEGVDLG
jgi:hypothetical protein